MHYFNIGAWQDDRGTTAVEFGIVGPVFIMLVVGILYTCLALLEVGSLHYAVEEGARCASVKTTVCNTPEAIVAYTKDHYFGPASSPIFEYEAAACGKYVTASANYVANLGLKSVTIPISASACFP
jgi:Flp pilus assembly protein TadG